MTLNQLPATAIGKYATSAVPVAAAKQTVEEVRRNIFAAADKYETINYVYVLKKKQLVGVASIKELVRSGGNKLLGQIMHRDLVTVRAHSHRERGAIKALERSIKALPVVDKNGNFLGVVPSDALLKILHEEANQDFFYFAGSNKGVLRASIVSQVKARLPWVLVGLLSGLVSTSVIAAYESVILQLVKIVAFIPVMLSISGNVATQSAVLFVRELVYGRVTWGAKALAHEGLIGVLIGIVSGLSLMLIAIWLHDEPLVGIIVAVSIVMSQAAAAMLGLTIPWLFAKLGKDPAMGSGSVVTTLMDIVVTTVYLSVAWGMLQLI